MEEDLLGELLSVAESLSNNNEFKNTNIAKEIDIFDKEESEVRNSNNIRENNEKSVVHTGLSDSSDDEDNKYFEEAKYNDYGKNIKKLLTTNGEKSSETDSEPSTWTKKRTSNVFNNTNNVKQLSTPPIVKKQSTSDVSCDPVFGIRIINPLISNKVLLERMQGRESISMAKLKWYLLRLTPEKDWVIGGVIIQKFTKTSQKGSQYSLWSLSDLHGDIKTVSMFLFGNAHKNLWKTVVGTVIGVLNPKVLDKKDTSKDEACLSVDNHQKIMILGQSKDMGTCKSVKKNGEPCTTIINKNQCDYCLYHIKQEYQKYSKRSDMQSTFSGSGLTALRNKVLGKNEVFYAGKSYMAIPATKSKKLTIKDDNRLKSLNNNLAVNSNQFTKMNNLTKRKKAATKLEIPLKQRSKDLELLKKLSSVPTNSEKRPDFNAELSREVTLEESRTNAISVIKKLKENKLARDDVDDKSSKKAFEADLSREVTLEESKINALSVINKLKAKKIMNGVPKTKENEKELDVIADKNDEKIDDSQEDNGESDSNLKINGGKDEFSEITREIALDEAGTSTNNKNNKLTVNKLIKDDGTEGAVKSDQNLSKESSKNAKIGGEMCLNGAKNGKVDDLKMNNYRNDKNINSNLKINNNLKSDNNKGKGSESANFNTQNNKNRPFLDSPTFFPSLSNNSKRGVDLNKPISTMLKDKAKMNAIRYIQQNGPLEKSNPMNVRGNPKKRKLNADTANQMEENDPKKQKIQENGFFSERFKKMMAATSSHTDLIEQHDDEQKEKYFKKLEIREKMEEKMAGTFKLECKAVRCLKCKYTSFSASDECKADKHPLKVYDTFKRFFKCGNCGNRTVCLDVVPLVACKNCGSGKWERTSIMKEKSVKSLHCLSIRGGEEKFLNSVAMNSNLDLLVPTD